MSRASQTLQPPGAGREVSPSEAAASNLAYIRATMQQASTYTGVSGAGMVLVGLIGCCAGLWSLNTEVASTPWLRIWGIAASLAGATGAMSLWWKSRRLYGEQWHPAGRRFVYALLPAMFAGALLTQQLVYHGVAANAPALVPLVWLVCYGTGAFAAGFNSVPAIRALGATALLGAIACAWQPEQAALWLLITFGPAHLLTGAIIAARHGG